MGMNLPKVLELVLNGGRCLVTGDLVWDDVQDMDPAHFQGEQGLENLVGLIRGFWAKGGMELSLNMLDEETLRQAQGNPDEFQHIMVRVFGLSARFVCLSRELQEVIIDRTVAAGRAG